jgi:glucose-6-phosphate 1-epimerase
MTDAMKRAGDFALPAGLRRVFLGEGNGTFPALEVATPACNALVSLQGAQLLRMASVAGEELCWLSPGARFLPGRAVRGGIPLCFPWFGTHPANPALPAHGFARVRDWRLADATVVTDGSVSLCFELADDAATRALWPHAFRATLNYTLGAALTLDFMVTNAGEAAFAFGFALHNYLPVTDVSSLRIEGLGGLPYTDKLANNARLRLPEGALRISGETDRVFHAAGGRYRVVDEVTGVTLELDATDCRDVVVWNPWATKAASLGDVPADAWRRMVCVECGNTGATDVQLAPGETRRWRQRIAARR